MKIGFEFALTDGLDDKLGIMAEEEKASTATSPFASLKDLVSIGFWTETALYDFVIGKVFFESFHEKCSLVEGYSHV